MSRFTVTVDGPTLSGQEAGFLGDPAVLSGAPLKVIDSQHSDVFAEHHRLEEEPDTERERLIRLHRAGTSFGFKLFFMRGNETPVNFHIWDPDFDFDTKQIIDLDNMGAAESLTLPRINAWAAGRADIDSHSPQLIVMTGFLTRRLSFELKSWSNLIVCHAADDQGLVWDSEIPF